MGRAILSILSHLLKRAVFKAVEGGEAKIGGDVLFEPHAGAGGGEHIGGADEGGEVGQFKGGGFQGGVLIASAILLVFLGYGSLKVKKTFNDHKLHSSETVAEIIYVVLGLLGIIGGFNFCINFVFDGLGFDTSVLMNHAVGYHVMGGIICLLAMMLSLLDKDEDDDSEEKEGEV